MTLGLAAVLFTSSKHLSLVEHRRAEIRRGVIVIYEEKKKGQKTGSFIMLFGGDLTQ